jgi:hypothetical protein
MHENGVPATLHECMDMARRIDTAQWLSYKATQGTSSSSPRTQKQGSGKSQTQGTQNVMQSTSRAQQPGYIYSQSPPPGTTPTFQSALKAEPVGQARPKISPEEKERRRQNNLCFYCGRADHISKFCPHRRGAQVNEVKAAPTQETKPQPLQPDDSWKNFANLSAEDAFHNTDF